MPDVVRDDFVESTGLLREARGGHSQHSEELGTPSADDLVHVRFAFVSRDGLRAESVHDTRFGALSSRAVWHARIAEA